MTGNKKGTTLLIENIIFIILNLVFIAILVFFLLSKSGTAAVLEEKYSKEIALLLDSAKPGMVLSVNVNHAIEIAKDKLGEDRLSEIVDISGNVVTVKLRDNGGYSYSFFNDVGFANCYLSRETNEYVFFIGGYDEQKGC